MKITFIIIDPHPTYVALVFENECRPWLKRTVQIELTPEQEKAISLRETGQYTTAGVTHKIREEIIECFIDRQVEPKKELPI